MKRRSAVVVTGASSGIGAATAALLARNGYTVFAGVRSSADAQRAAQTDGIVPLMLDITDGEAIKKAAEAVEKAGVPLRAVVNNAGIVVAGPLEHLPAADLRRQFEVNVVGALAVTQALLPMLRRTRGRIVFVGSISGRLAVPYIAPYSASKAALRALAGALRVELKPVGIGVTLIEPSSVRTPIWAKGRKTAADMPRVLGAQPAAAYGKVLQAMVASTHREEAAGMAPEAVAAAIVNAIEHPRPRAEHLVGLSARAGSIVAMLPARLREWCVSRSLRLPSHD